MKTKEMIVKASYAVGNVKFNLKEFETVYNKLESSFRLSSNASLEDKVLYIKESSYITASELHDTCLDSICMPDYINLKCKNEEVHEVLIDGEWFDVRISELKVSVNVVLSMIWMRGQGNDYQRKYFWRMKKNASENYWWFPIERFFQALEIMGTLDQYYPPLKRMGETKYVSWANIKGERMDITDRQNHLERRGCDYYSWLKNKDTLKISDIELFDDNRYFYENW